MDAQPQTQPVQPIEIHILWDRGKIQLSAPQNPLLVMKILGDTLSSYAEEVQKHMMQQPNQIVVPQGAMVDQRIVEAAEKKE